MYQIEDKSEAIRLVQKYLSFIYPEKDVAQNGIYNLNTRSLISDFQAESNVEVSGSVDYITYGLLYSKYKKCVLVRKMQGEVSHLLEFPISIGDFSDGVGQINNMLLSVADSFGIHTDLRPSRYFSNESAALARNLRDIFQIKDADYVDEEMYDRLIKEAKSTQKFKQNFR